MAVCDIVALRAVLQALPVGMRAAFEFRHASWHRDDVLDALDRAGAAWVIPHRPHGRPPLEVTGGWSYVRFHQGTVLGPATVRRRCGGGPTGCRICLHGRCSST